MEFLSILASIVISIFLIYFLFVLLFSIFDFDRVDEKLIKDLQNEVAISRSKINSLVYENSELRRKLNEVIEQKTLNVYKSIYIKNED